MAEMNSTLDSQMAKFGLGASSEPVTPPAGEPPAGNPPAGTTPSAVTVDGVQYTPEQAAAKLTELNGKLNELTGQDALANKELTSKLLEAINRLGTKPEEKAPEVTPEQFEAWKHEMDEKAASDFTGTTISLASDVVESKLAPVLQELKAIKEALSNREKKETETQQAQSQQSQAYNTMISAFKAAGVEKVEPAQWNEVKKYYSENLGVDMVKEAYNNPEGFNKKVKFFMSARGVNAGPNGLGLPAGGGMSGSQGAPDSGNKTLEQMKKFGLM